MSTKHITKESHIMSGFSLPAHNNRIKIVHSFDALIATPFGPLVNALCWQRVLVGDFDEVAAQFRDEKDVMSLDKEMLAHMRRKLSPTGQLAVDVMIADHDLLQAHGLQPSTECVPRYDRDDNDAIIPTDVYSFHADRATIAADTYLCSYNEAASEGLRNEEAQRHIDIPATRAALLKDFEQYGSGDFDDYVRDNCYDLHYTPIENAVPFSFGIGNMWRIAIEYPGCPVPPCLHRAPQTIIGRPPRLLLIS